MQPRASAIWEAFFRSVFSLGGAVHDSTSRPVKCSRFLVHPTCRRRRRTSGQGPLCDGSKPGSLLPVEAVRFTRGLRQARTLRGGVLGAVASGTRGSRLRGSSARLASPNGLDRSTFQWQSSVRHEMASVCLPRRPEPSRPLQRIRKTGNNWGPHPHGFVWNGSEGWRLYSFIPFRRKNHSHQCLNSIKLFLRKIRQESLTSVLGIGNCRCPDLVRHKWTAEESGQTTGERWRGRFICSGNRSSSTRSALPRRPRRHLHRLRDAIQGLGSSPAFFSTSRHGLHPAALSIPPSITVLPTPIDSRDLQAIRGAKWRPGHAQESASRAWFELRSRVEPDERARPDRDRSTHAVRQAQIGRLDSADTIE